MSSTAPTADSVLEINGNTQAYEQWVFSDAGGGKVYLTSAAHNKHVSVHTNKVVGSPNKGDYEKFKVETHGGMHLPPFHSMLCLCLSVCLVADRWVFCLVGRPPGVCVSPQHSVAGSAEQHPVLQPEQTGLGAVAADRRLKWSANYPQTP
jgi:hypothetical protein